MWAGPSVASAQSGLGRAKFGPSVSRAECGLCEVLAGLTVSCAKNIPGLISGCEGLSVGVVK